jgi:hypothetical protein
MKSFLDMKKEAEQYAVLTEIVNKNYHKEPLQEIFSKFIVPILKQRKDLVHKYDIDTGLLTKTVSTIQKAPLSQIVAKFYCYSELLKALVDSFSEKEKKVLELVVWFKEVGEDKITKATGLKIPTHRNNYRSEATIVPPFFSFFLIYNPTGYPYYNRNGQSTLSLPPELSKLLEPLVEQPKDYNLVEVPEIPSQEKLLYSTDLDIFADLPVVQMYLQQQEMKFNANGKPAITTLQKMKKYCNITEFFPEDKADKQRSTLRTLLLVAIADSLPHNITDNIELIKHFYKEIKIGKFGMGAALLIDTNIISKQYLKSKGMELFFQQVLPDFPSNNSWILVENIINSCIYKSLDVAYITSMDIVYDNLIIQDGDEKVQLDSSHHQEKLLGNSVRAYCFLLATLGMAEIAYQDEASTNPYETIRYVRLTELGKFITGRIKEYKAKNADISGLILDTNNLFISYQGDNKTALHVIDKVAKPITPHFFKVDKETLLADCNRPEEVLAKIQAFKKVVPAPIPTIWENFFDEMAAKAFKVKEKNDLIVFQIPKQQTELLQLFAKDGFLKTLIFRAEDYHIVIERKNVGKMKNYLKKFGFLIDFNTYNHYLGSF